MDVSIEFVSLVTRSLLLMSSVIIIFISKGAAGGCNDDNETSDKNDNDGCWYHLWYFWLIMALFFLGAMLLVLIYCKQQAKQARINRLGLRNTQMVLPPAYDEPGHLPPPYSVALTLTDATHTEHVQSHGPQGLVPQTTTARTSETMRAESVPPPYSPPPFDSIYHEIGPTSTHPRTGSANYNASPNGTQLNANERPVLRRTTASTLASGVHPPQDSATVNQILSFPSASTMVHPFNDRSRGRGVATALVRPCCFRNPISQTVASISYTSNRPFDSSSQNNLPVLSVTQGPVIESHSYRISLSTQNNQNNFDSTAVEHLPPNYHHRVGYHRSHSQELHARSTTFGLNSHSHGAAWLAHANNAEGHMATGSNSVPQSATSSRLATSLSYNMVDPTQPRTPVSNLRPTADTSRDVHQQESRCGLSNTHASNRRGLSGHKRLV